MAENTQHPENNQQQTFRASVDEPLVPSLSSASLVPLTRSLSLSDPAPQSHSASGSDDAERPPSYDSDDSMPPLGVISDDDDGDDLVPTPRAGAQSPVPRTTSRRARVDDEEDEDAERQTNRQRISSPGTGAVDPDHFYHPSLHEHGQQAPPAQAPPLHPPQQAPTDNADAPRLPLFDRIAFTVDFLPAGAHGIGMPGAAGAAGVLNQFGRAFEFRLPANPQRPASAPGAPTARNNDVQQPADAAGPQPQLPAGATNQEFNHFLQHLRDSLAQMPIGAATFPWASFLDIEEPEDPGRAKRLMSGLEEVPVGLVKRMERVGETDGEMPVCAVCFDSLLEVAEPVAEEAKPSGHDHESQSSEDVSMDIDSEEPISSAASSTSNDPAISSTASTSGSSSTSDDTPPAVDTSLDHKIFVLPCAHAFHGSCLRPWFTRPHRTTCPTCRFDIDPESLTYLPLPPRAQNREARLRDLARAQAYTRALAQAQAAGGAPVPAPGTPAAAAAAQGPAQPQPPLDSNPLPQVGVPPNHPPQAQATGQNRRRQLPVGFIIDFSMVIPGNGPPPTGAAQQAPGDMGVPHAFGPPPPVPPAPVAADAVPQGEQREQDPFNAIAVGVVEHIMQTIYGAHPPPGDNPPPATHVGSGVEATTTDANRDGPARPNEALPPASAAPAPGTTALRTGTLPAMRADPLANGAEHGPLPSFDELLQLTGADQPPGYMPHANAQPVHQEGDQQQVQPEAHPEGPGDMQQAVGAFMNNFAVSLIQRMFPGAQPIPAAPRAPGQGGPAGLAPGPLNQMPGLPFAQIIPPPPPPPPPGPIPFAMPFGARPRAPRPSAEKRQWVPPPPPGMTLREKVEKQERELGLRCSDISCGLGPSDEDPVPVVDPRSIQQVSIRPLKKDGVEASGKDRVCEHTFHPACLVSAERVAGWSGADEKTDPAAEDEEVQVSCPVCRAVGCISRDAWDEGACALA